MEKAEGPLRPADAEAEPGLVARGEPTAESRTTRPRSLIIVAREEPDLWLYLTRSYGGIQGLEVLLDRRQGERRHQVQPYTPERRQAERRRLPAPEKNRHRQPFRIVPQ